MIMYVINMMQNYCLQINESLVYEINSKDVYEQCFKDKELFDFSGYPIDSKHYNS